MAKKTVRKKVAETQLVPVAEPVHTTPMPTVPPKKELILEGDPEAQLAYASKAAKALMTVVSQKPNPVYIGGKQYLEYGDWQVLARFYGATVEIEWTNPIYKDEKDRTPGNIMGFEARALVKRGGEVISSAEGMCTRDERRWAKADDYAIRSMAQTRTAAKALRNAFGWVAELAGYSATPAEEMPYDKKEPMLPFKPSTADGRKVAIKSLLTTLGYELVTKEEYESATKETTGLDLTEENYDEIISILKSKVDADPNLKLDRLLDDKDN